MVGNSSHHQTHGHHLIITTTTSTTTINVTITITDHQITSTTNKVESNVNTQHHPYAGIEGRHGGRVRCIVGKNHNTEGIR